MDATQKSSYYDILGVPERASQQEIRKAYLNLARRYHPDKTGGDKKAEEQLKRINEAYDTLKNEDRRKAYDAERQNPFSTAGPEGFEWASGDGTSGFSFHSSGLDEGAFADLFDAFFGAGPGTARTAATPTRGADITANLRISLEEVAHGAQKRIRLARNDSNGARQQTTVSVRIPPGVEHGARLRLSGQGHEGRHGAPPGDLYARIVIDPHPLFSRHGHNLHLALPISFPDAALGATVRVPTLTGKADLRIPPGTQHGRQFRLKGLGMPMASGRHGDLLVRVLVEVPAHLNPDQRQIIESLRSGETPGQYTRKESFWARLERMGGIWADTGRT